MHILADIQFCVLKAIKIETQSILTAMQNLGHKCEILEASI
jgi:hypothetical protein